MRQDNYRFKIALSVAFTLLVAGLLWSRALLSISHLLMGILIISALRLQSAFRSPLVLWTCAPLLLFLLGWYQKPIDPSTYDYLLTLLMYPIAGLAGYVFINYSKSAKIIWLIAGGLSLLYPVCWYLIHFQQVNIAYGQGQSLPTFMEGDHVRYGIFLNSMLLLLATSRDLKPATRNVLILVLAGIIIVMSVRTAWVGLLIIIATCAFSKNIAAYKLFRKLLVAVIPIFVLAYLFVPTVKQKVNYMVYDYEQYEQKDISSSDGTRRAINQSAWQATKQQGAAGSGWAVIPEKIMTNFQQLYPEEEQQFFWPFNQWLFWWMGSGIMGMLLFSAWLFYPIWWGVKNGNSAVVAWSLVITASCIVESTLSLQYGVFLHIWPLALLWNNAAQHAESG